MRWSGDVNANARDPEGFGHFFQGSAVTAADVEDALDGKRITPQRPNDAARVAEEPVNRGYVAMDARR